MPRNVTQYTILISCPGDIKDVLSMRSVLGIKKDPRLISKVCCADDPLVGLRIKDL